MKKILFLFFIFIIACSNVSHPHSEEIILEFLDKEYFDNYDFYVNGDLVEYQNNNSYSVTSTEHCPCNITDNTTSSDLIIIDKTTKEKLFNDKILLHEPKNILGLSFYVRSIESTSYSEYLRISVEKDKSTEEIAIIKEKSRKTKNYILYSLLFVVIIIIIILVSCYSISKISDIKFKNKAKIMSLKEKIKKEFGEF